MSTVHIVEINGERTVLISEQLTPDVIISDNTTTEVVESTEIELLLYEKPKFEIIEVCTPCSGEAVPNGQSGAAIFITDVIPDTTGIVAQKSWEDGDTPAQSDIKECTTDVDNVRVYVWAEGGIGDFTPTVTVDDITVANLSRHGSGVRVFEGYAVVNITETRTITVSSDTGTSDTVIINRAAAGPSVSYISFGTYPGTQTELKSGDTIAATVITDDTATSVTLRSGGANASNTTFNSSVDNGDGTLTFSGNITISNASGSQTVTAFGTNSLGTDGDDFESTETLQLNQTFPTISAISISYPTGQTAIKNSETVTATATVTDFDTISYTTSGDISLTSSGTTYEATKTIERVGGNYVVTGTNYTISATRNANDSTSSRSGLIRIANSAPTAGISIDGLPSRLRSVFNYTVRLTANQQLSETPTLDADKGDFSAAFSGSGAVYTKTLSIEDTTERGTGTFSNVNLVGLSGLVGDTITSGSTYIVGGFSNRTITFDAFATHMPIGATVADFTKTRVRYTGTIPWLSRETSTAFLVDGFTIVDAAGNYDTNGDHLWLTDTDLSGANATGSLKVDIEEIV